jgi:capsular polysaccharide export protein
MPTPTCRSTAPLTACLWTQFSLHERYPSNVRYAEGKQVLRGYRLTMRTVCETVEQLSMEQDWLPPDGNTIGVPYVTLRHFPRLHELAPNYRLVPLESSGATVDAVAGWGLKRASRWARFIARRLSRPFLTMEDGFLRSVGLGKERATAVSMVMDDVGIYYDARSTSRLEEILASTCFGPTRSRAVALREHIVKNRLSKYNHLPDRPPQLAPPRRRRILLAEQVAGDLSIAGACADEGTFAALLRDALSLGNVDVVVRSHPDVIAGRALGTFPVFTLPSKVFRLDDAISPHAVLDRVDEVWTVSSQLGFDALIRGLPVRCYGVPFYAGWGLTDDRPVSQQAKEALSRRRCARRGVALDVVDLIDAALIRYPLYADPITGKSVSPEQAIERLRSWRAHANVWRGELDCIGIAPHKRPVLRRYCTVPGGRLRFLPRATAGRRQLIWGSPFRAGAEARFRGAITVEDGLIRSIGLGFPGNAPISLCFDKSGIYYDATRPSDLETMLETSEFPRELIQRASRLRGAILAMNLTKYNLQGAVPEELPLLANGRRRMLVVGQVPDDQSLRLGLPTHASNLEFLSAVRQAFPDAYLVFKEHPDLVARKRKGQTDLRAAGAWADHLAIDGDASAWIDFADVVHVRTSLMGFEALLRRKQVVCHGAPFFSGWGLTTDMVHIARRTRQRSLDELVAAALICYPTYVHPVQALPMEAEDAVSWLGRKRAILMGEAERCPVFDGRAGNAHSL